MKRSYALCAVALCVVAVAAGGDVRNDWKVYYFECASTTTIATTATTIDVQSNN